MFKLINHKNSLEHLVMIINVIGGTGFFVYYYWFFYKSPLDEGIYELLSNDLDFMKHNSLWFSDSLLVGYVSHHPLFSLLYFLFVALFYFLVRESIFWKNLDVSKSFLVVIFILSLIFTFNNGFSNFNYFTENGYYFDRVLLIISSILLLYTPLAFFLYFPLVFLFFSSFNFPLDEFSFADKSLPLFMLFYTLSLFGSHTILKRLSVVINFENMWIKGILITICCSYLAPFLIKISISENYLDWFLIEDFSLAFEKYIDRGWFIDYSRSFIDNTREFLNKYKDLLLLTALLIESFGIFLFFNWRYSIVIIGLFMILNVNIYLLSAIFFWKWIISNFLIIVYLFHKKPELKLSPKYTLITIVSCVIFSYSIPFFPKLGWYSISYSLYYRLDVLNEKGELKSIQGKDMAPFDMYFAFSRWDVFNQNQPDVSSLDSKQIKFFNSLTIQQQKEEIKVNGINKYNEDNDKILELFLREYFTNFNKDGFKKKLTLSPPAHIQVNYKNPFMFKTSVNQIQITVWESWYGNDSNKDNQRHVLKTIEF
ncbi:hypothetical protein N9483_06935 [Flavobacteriaceae bacterium]|nr:hypothetical protein [Flavobacteriaceae bacterium]